MPSPCNADAGWWLRWFPLWFYYFALQIRELVRQRLLVKPNKNSLKRNPTLSTTRT